jgi:conjugative transfer signal peptidase TraF
MKPSLGSMPSRLITAVLSVVAIAALLTPADARPGSLVWNYTPSVPVGLYRIESGPWRTGDLVAIEPSAGLRDILQRAGVLKQDRLLLKRVAAVGGDTVCREGESIFLNGAFVARARKVDATGVSLPEWSGCRSLTDEEVFLLGDNPRSFDGRYFGPTGAADVLGPVRTVFQSWG